MPDELPTSPRLAYQRIIDELDERTPGVIARRIVEDGHYSQNSLPEFPELDEFNALVDSLTQEQREVLGRLCDFERHGGMHDLLACLSWWIDCGGLSLCYDGERLPVDLSGMGLHGDYVGRSQDWEWPPED